MCQQNTEIHSTENLIIFEVDNSNNINNNYNIY